MSDVSRRQTRLAMLTALTALLGVVVGGLIGFFSNRALQDHESEVAALGAARVYQERFLQAVADVSLMLETGRTVDPSTRIPPELGVDDRRSIASELESRQWLEVLHGEASVRDLLTVDALVRAPHRGASLGPTTCQTLREHLPRLIRGAEALAGLAEVGVPVVSREPALERRC